MIRKIALSVILAITLSGCALFSPKPKIVYPMPDVPEELLLPTQELKVISPYRSELGLVPAVPSK
jgi:hypothetical protein